MIPVCPKCHQALFILYFKGVEVDFCQRCRGVWLDAGELEGMMCATGAEADAPLLGFQNSRGAVPRGSESLCPRCDLPLEEIVVKSETMDGIRVTLDRCSKGHGLWFDADELQRLLSMFPAKSGAHRTINCLHDVFGGKTIT